MDEMDDLELQNEFLQWQANEQAHDQWLAIE